jgi:hypothetical protein
MAHPKVYISNDKRKEILEESTNQGKRTSLFLMTKRKIVSF